MQPQQGAVTPTVQVRYVVTDVDAAVAFYTKLLGFTEVMHPAPTFALLSNGDLRLALTAPNPQAGGGQSVPDGKQQVPGGWNRFALEVENLEATVNTLLGATSWSVALPVLITRVSTPPWVDRRLNVKSRADASKRAWTRLTESGAPGTGSLLNFYARNACVPQKRRRRSVKCQRAQELRRLRRGALR